ncbi:restriction endonuclease [Azospirillum sp. sgz302134]
MNDKKKPITIVDAIRTVLKSSREAMSPKDVYDAIITQELYEFKADQPVSVVRQQIRRRCLGLEFPSALPEKIFEKTADGRYTLRCEGKAIEEALSDETMAISPISSVSKLESIRELYGLHIAEVREQILEDLKNLPPPMFEIFAQGLVRKYGFHDVIVTKVSKDGGIDGHGKLKVGLATLKVAFQCKRWTKNSVGRPEIDKFRGAVQGRYEQGIFFTTARFTEGAIAESTRSGVVPIVLFDGDGIFDVMMEKRFGVAFEDISIPSPDLDSAFAG